MASGSGRRVLESEHQLFHLLQEMLGRSYLTLSVELCQCRSMPTIRLHILVILDIRQRKKVVQERLRSKTIEIKGEIVGTSLIQMLLSNLGEI